MYLRIEKSDRNHSVKVSHKNITIMKMKISALFLSLLIMLSGCSTIQNATNKAKGGTIGGAGGAALGAIIGALAGKGKGAAIGAAVGAVVGGGAGVLIGNKMDKAKKAAEAANAQAEVIKDEQTGLTYVKVTFPSGILFATGKDALSAESKTNLATFAKNLSSDMDLYIKGYTDNVGFKGSTAAESKEKNVALSQKRADAVSSYLKSNGLHSASQIKEVVGYGEEDPVGDNNTAAGREQNRRVEVYVMPSEEMINNAKSQAGES